MLLTLPAAPFAHDVFLLLAQGVTLTAFAGSIDVTPDWLEAVLAGDVTEVPLLAVVRICNRLRILPDDVWPPHLTAMAFAHCATTPFDQTDYPFDVPDDE